MIARILSGLIGVLMLLNCLWWILDPSNAAEELAMPLIEGLGSNSQIGDFTAFFFTAGLFACIGAYRAEHNAIIIDWSNDSPQFIDLIN